jgi:hypothetical protein
MAAISITNEKAITASSETSYKMPISTLPRNQNACVRQDHPRYCP